MNKLSKTKKALLNKSKGRKKINTLNIELIRLNNLIVSAKEKQQELYNKEKLVSSDGSPGNYDNYIFDLTKEYNKKKLLLENYKSKLQ